MECKRCGHCCMAVGREFWLHGDYENKPEYPKLQKIAPMFKDKGDGMPCMMLEMAGGVAACTIEKVYGHDAKPEVCRDYPELNCHQESKTFTGRGVCSQISG